MDVIIADNCPGLIQGIKLWLDECNLTFPVREAAEWDEVIDLLSDNERHILITSSKWILDVPVFGVIEDLFLNFKVSVMCLIEDENNVNKLYKAGIQGLLKRSVAATEFDWCLMELLNGKRYISSELLPHLTDSGYFHHNSHPNNNNIQLTLREKQILKYISEGFSNKEISDKLFISKRTVDNYRAGLLDKLGAKNTGQLIALAFEKQLISQG